MGDPTRYCNLGPAADEFRSARHLDSLMDFQGNDFKYFQGNDFKYIPFGLGKKKWPGIGLALPMVEVTDSQWPTL